MDEDLRIEMAKRERSALGRHGKQPATGLIAAFATALILSGCSYVPDYANPVEWYDSTVDYFDDDAPPPIPVADVPGANEPFPELSSTPETPLREIQLGTLDSVGEGLLADRANAQYTDDVIRSGGDPALAEPPTYQSEAPTFQSEVAAYQSEAPALQALPAPPVPALQPSTSVPIAPLAQVTQQAALQPAVVQPVPLQPRAVDRGIDVKTEFANLFMSSGPLGVAPAGSGTLFIAAPSAAPTASSSGLQSTASLISPTASFAGALFGKTKAAVIYFALASAHINKQGSAALHKVADYLKQSGGTLRVVGHASNRTKELSATSHELVNFDISFKRARAVADVLIRHGVAPDRIEVVAMSDSEPVYQEWMPSGEAGNRRAEVFINN